MSKELNTENKNKIRQEAIKRLSSNNQKPPKEIIDAYAEMLENLWLNNEVAFDWEVQ